ncbi:hypothetical protein Godav_000561, partial [Gossypium davidsonii]|nr:hypothetical protein [Gossypium davidsonii]
MMERLISVCLWLTLVLYLILRVACNAEGDVLNALKTNMADPNNVLQSWDPTLVNPCTWYHVTCNDRNSVTRVDLQNANLSGQLVPQLGQLPNLQYLELYGNNISGIIPEELGNLTNLLSLDLYLNNLTGGIPTTLGKLTKLQFLYEQFKIFMWLTCLVSLCFCFLVMFVLMYLEGFYALTLLAGLDRRLNNNSLTGTIPLSLTTVMTLQVLDLSNNQLVGDIPVNGSFTLFHSISFSNNKLNNPPPASPTSS